MATELVLDPWRDLVPVLAVALDGLSGVCGPTHARCAKQQVQGIDDVAESRRLFYDDCLRKILPNLGIAAVDYEGDAALMETITEGCTVVGSEPVVENGG